MVKYNQLCSKCKKNYVTVFGKQKKVFCYDCQKDELKAEVQDPNMKKMFNIPEDYYKDNSFLRDIKSKYIKYGNLTDKQIEAFKKVVEKLSSKQI